jgi:hypothetical protein
MTNDRPDLSSERAPHMDKAVTFHEPQTGLDTKTNRLTVSRNVTLTVSKSYGPPRPVTGIVFTLEPRRYQSPPLDLVLAVNNDLIVQATLTLPGGGMVTSLSFLVCYARWTSLWPFPRIHKSVGFNDNPRQDSLWPTVWNKATRHQSVAWCVGNVWSAVHLNTGDVTWPSYHLHEASWCQINVHCKTTNNTLKMSYSDRLTTCNTIIIQKFRQLNHPPLMNSKVHYDLTNVRHGLYTKPAESSPSSEIIAFMATNIY